MVLQSSGPISLNDIAGEFGGTTPHSLSEYYGSGGAPGSGALSLDDFYGLSDYSGPTSVEMWIVGGGGGGGSVYGATSNSAGGGGAGGGVKNETSQTISGGQVFTINIGSGGAKDNTGQNTEVIHDTTGASYVGVRGGRGASVHNGNQDQNAQRGGGAGTGNVTAAASGVGSDIGAGGEALIHTDGNVAGGGGGGANGSNSFQDAYISIFGDVTSGRGQYGVTFSQGVPAAMELGYGGSGGSTKTNQYTGGNANTCVAAFSRGYGGGGGGGAWKSGCDTVKNGSPGSDGVAIIQYSDTYAAPSALTGTYTEYVQDGYRTYVFTGDGTITW